MNLDTIKQAIELQQEKAVRDFTMDDLLSLVVDLFNNVDRNFKDAGIEGVSKLEDIGVKDETRFSKYLCRLAVSLGRIYHKNMDIFSEDGMTAVKRKAVKELTEVKEQAEILDSQLLELQSKIDELEQLNQGTREKLAAIKSLEEQLEQLDNLRCEYEDKLEKSRTLQEDIDDYGESRIPEIEADIAEKESSFNQLYEKYSELCARYSGETEKNDLIRKEYEEKLEMLDAVTDDREALRQQCTEADTERENVKAETSELENELKKIEQDKNVLGQQMENIKAEIYALKRDKAALIDATGELMADRNYLETEKIRAEKDYDRVKLEHDDIQHKAEQLEEKRTELLKEIESYKSMCENEHADIEKYEHEISQCSEQFESMRRNQENRRKELAEQKKRMEDARIDFFIYKIRLERLIRNSQIQQEYLGKKQKQIAAQIKALLDDDVINKSWMYSIDDLRDVLINRREKMNEQIRNEIRLFESVLLKLETDDTYGGV